MPLEFIEEGHKYLYDGKEVVSVTQVIESSCPFGWQGEAVDKAAHFGTVVHRTLELLDNKKLGEYDPQIETWVTAWEQFLSDFDDTKFAWLIADIKTGTYSKTWPIQTAAYWGLTHLNPETCIEGRFYSEKFDYAGTVDRIYQGRGNGTRVVCIQLLDTGDYKAYYTKDLQMNFNVFLSMLNIFKWRKQNGLLRKEAEL